MFWDLWDSAHSLLPLCCNPSLKGKLARRCWNRKCFPDWYKLPFGSIWKAILASNRGRYIDCKAGKVMKQWAKDSTQRKTRVKMRKDAVRIRSPPQQENFPAKLQKTNYKNSFKSTPCQSGMVANHENLSLLFSPTWSSSQPAEQPISGLMVLTIGLGYLMSLVSKIPRKWSPKFLAIGSIAQFHVWRHVTWLHGLEDNFEFVYKMSPRCSVKPGFLPGYVRGSAVKRK